MVDNASSVDSFSNGTIYSIPKSKPGNLTNYLAANQFCQAKGGFLAAISSKVKQDVVQNLVVKYFGATGVKLANFLFGSHLFKKLI